MTTISDFFRDKTILITGGPGFLGRILVAKILTALPDIRKIYLLIRPRTESNGSICSAEERLEEFFSLSVFEKLREIHGPQFDSWIREKVFAVEGDLTYERLGLSDDWYQALQNEVQVFINSAAFVKFDPPIDEAIQFNASSVKETVEFTKGCNDAILIHVSTAFVCGNRPGQVAEELHPPYEVSAKRHREETGQDIPQTLEAEIEDLLQIGERVRADADHPTQLEQFKAEARKQVGGAKKNNQQLLDRQIESIRRRWIEKRLVEAGLNRARERGWSDTYLYTKSLGEQMIARTRGDLPTAIIRQSIMESSLEEPEPGWLGGTLRMADPLIVGFGKGRLPDFPGDPNSILDIIPVDFVVNAILAAAVQTYHKRGIEVYHIATSARNPITFGGVVDATYDYFVANPMQDRGKPIMPPVWKYPAEEKFKGKLQSRVRMLDRASWLLACIPSKWAKQKNRRIAIIQNEIEKLLYYITIYAPYTRMSFVFESDKMQQLYDALSPAEQQQFNFDVSRIDWGHYLKEIHIPGIKKHGLKLGDDLEKSRISEPADQPSSEQSETESEQSETEPEQSETQNPEVAYKTILDWVAQQAELIPDKTALQIKRDGEWVQYTYRQVYDRARQIAFFLWKRGYREGDKVILISENQPEWGIAYLAALHIGVIVVPIDQQTPAREIAALAEFTDAKAIFTSESLFAQLSELGAPESSREVLSEVLNVNRFCDAHEEVLDPLEAVADGFPYVEIGPDTIASIIFTMGTTVDARGAMLSHRGFIENILAVAQVLPPEDTDRFLSVLPLYHALGFSCSFLMSIYGGTTVTYINSFKPTSILETMRETKTTVLIGVPRLFKLLYDTLARHVVKTPIQRDTPLDAEVIEKVQAELGGHIRVLVSGGASLPDEVYDGFEQFGLTIYQGYGMTETAPVLSVNPSPKSKRGSVGPAVKSVELQILNPDSNGIGEIVTKSPSMMAGYYRNPKATAEVIRNGLLYTGDLGYLDADGYLYITGRSKNVIVSGTGKNIYPIELEELYRHSPDIAEICVVGVTADNSSDETAHAVIVPRQKENGGEKAIREHLRQCASNLPTYQHLHKVHFWNTELPKTPELTVDRHAVKAHLMAELSEASIVAPTAEIPDEDWTSENCERGIIAEFGRLARTPVSRINADTDLDIDLGIDSLMRVELLMRLESKLQQPIPEHLIGEVRTVGDVIEAVQRFYAQADYAPPDELAPADSPETARGGIKLTGLFRVMVGSIYRHRFGFQCEGVEHIPIGKPYIIASNHNSHLDTPAIMTALGKEAKRLYILGAKDYWFADKGFKSWFVRTCLNVLPIDRSGNVLQDVRIAKEALAENKSLLIYPEGGRSVTGELQPFKPGLGLLAHEANVPIVPAHISGTYQALPKGRNLPRKSQIRVVFGIPVTCDALQSDNTGELNHEIYRTIADEVRARIQELGNGRMED